MSVNMKREEVERWRGGSSQSLMPMNVFPSEDNKLTEGSVIFCLSVTHVRQNQLTDELELSTDRLTVTERRFEYADLPPVTPS